MSGASRITLRTHEKFDSNAALRSGLTKLLVRLVEPVGSEDDIEGEYGSALELHDQLAPLPARSFVLRIVITGVDHVQVTKVTLVAVAMADSLASWAAEGQQVARVTSMG
jgi:hypothetical protein